MILAVNNISKSFGEEVVLSGVSFQMNEHDKVALIGRNGAGKTTLLRIILGELSADSGEITLAKATSVGYLSQHQDLSGNRTIYEEVMSSKSYLNDIENRLRTLEENMKVLSGDGLSAAYKEYDNLNHTFEQENGYALRSEVTGIIKGLGFTEEEMKKPMVGIGSSYNEIVPGHMNLDKIAEKSGEYILLPIGADHLDVEEDICEQINSINEILEESYEIKLSSPFEYFNRVQDNFGQFEFDDDFEFVGTQGNAYQMIGNAVPVLMAKAIGECVIDILNGNNHDI